ncbi:class I SAM-dependent methyltransferase [Larkinella insperata]|uniref:Class I SAM-dependent methyltransferase n=1 Tax=Larkinella insperata TaxID=332158 RepID=A0ABW3Q5J5_9BACT|nr:class I SAM-dependent methyltransferase [Larkinella insperata]
MQSNQLELLTPESWSSYELIDTGGFEKLERFGSFILSRPEPQAIWPKSLTDADWQHRSHAVFKRDKGSQEKGEWVLRSKMDEKWFIPYQSSGLDLTFKLSLSSFKHVGIFPEQAVNWPYIHQKVEQLPVEKPRVLNLFAYTGAASLAARQAGADVTHVDAVKQVITWSRENMEASGLDNIRWVVEDALKFVRREVRRGNTYNGLILDPPAYGRGPEGEKWLLEEHLSDLLQVCAELLDRQNYFLIINLYSLGFSALILENLMRAHFGERPNTEFGELYLADGFAKRLPLGVFYRFSSI